VFVCRGRFVLAKREQICLNGLSLNGTDTMALWSYGWKNHAPRWWTLTFLRLPRSFGPTLEELSEVPGVQSVQIRSQTADMFYDVVVMLHETAFATDAFLNLKDGTELVGGRPEQQPAIPLPATLRALRNYQQEGAEWLVANKGGVLGDEMGLGKTLTALAAAEAMRNAWDPKAPVLIIGPKFTRDVWLREIGATFAGAAETFFACEGRKPTTELEQRLGRARWVFVHYEILDGWRAALTRPLYGRRMVVSIFDEAHWIKNPRSKRGKSALAVGPLAPARIVLSGTPIANRVTDLWPLLTIARGTGSFGTPFAFADRYTFHEKGTYGWTSLGTRRMPELQARLDTCYLRRTLADVGTELPPRTREQLRVDSHGVMPRELKRWTGGNVELALERFRDALAQGNLGADTLAAMTLWRQWTSESKVPTTTHLAASLLGEGEHVVVFCWQRDMAELLCDTIRKALDEGVEARIIPIHGGYSQEIRDAEVRTFQEGSTPTCLVATIDSLKEGVTLHRARRVVMHDLHWVPATMLQAEARVHRLGQTRPTVSTWVIVRDSIDEVLAAHLVAKALVIDEALDDAAAREAFDEVGLATKETEGAEFARRILEGT
jgi:SWI/SNF-related matrix-associated actin-dependent regulator 1 of chromatin subfamily A